MRNPDSDIGVNGRAIWVMLSQNTLGGCMYTRSETMACMRYLGLDIGVHYGLIV